MIQLIDARDMQVSVPAGDDADKEYVDVIK